MGVSGQLYVPAALLPGKEPPGTQWREKFLVPAGNRISAIQTVARCDTDWAIPARHCYSTTVTYAVEDTNRVR
jgi:hypothetical protein